MYLIYTIPTALSGLRGLGLAVWLRDGGTNSVGAISGSVLAALLACSRL